jgi:hypothetical protein
MNVEFDLILSFPSSLCGRENYLSVAVVASLRETFRMPGNELDPKIELAQKVTHAIRDLISEVPVSHEIVSLTPRVRAEALAEAAAWKAAAVAASMAIVPGPLGILTIIPALGQIWRIQRQLVSDIAACYGQTPSLTPTVMIYCLFKHGSATVFKETVVQLGGRLLVREASLRVFQKIIEKVSISVTQRVIGQFISRWLPAIGSVAIGAYTFRDTKKVAATAIDSFEKEIEAEFVVMPAEAAVKSDAKI